MTTTRVIGVISCFLFGALGAWSVSCFAFKFGWVDHPNGRSSHAIPTPKGGGIGILIAFLFSAVRLDMDMTFWLPAMLLALFSFLGDKADLSPKLRLPMQFAAALVFLFPLLFSMFTSTFQTIFFLVALSVFIVGSTNHYNFMDGINGIAGITGVIGFGLMAWLAALKGADQRIVFLCVSVSFACFGFLPFNVPKARIFMGDVGSILLGFVFGCLVILLSDTVSDFITAAAFLLPFYADEVTTMVVRLKDGERLTLPHRRHLYQLLANEMDIAHWKISVSYGAFQLAVGLGVLSLRAFGAIVLLVFTTACFTAFAWLSFRLRSKLERKTQPLIRLHHWANKEPF